MIRTSPMELFIIGLILALLGSFAIVSFSSLSETQDASMVQSIQINLQKIVTEASQRQGIQPNHLAAANVINAVKIVLPTEVKLSPTGLDDGPYELLFTQSGRKAIYAVDLNGDVRLKSLIGHWTRFRSTKGVINKN